MLITPSGGKWWRFRYTFDGKEKLLSLGTYPDIGLKEARAKRNEARRLLAGGVDPGEDRKTQWGRCADCGAGIQGDVTETAGCTGGGAEPHPDDLCFDLRGNWRT